MISRFAAIDEFQVVSHVESSIASSSFSLNIVANLVVAWRERWQRCDENIEIKGRGASVQKGSSKWEVKHLKILLCKYNELWQASDEKSGDKALLFLLLSNGDQALLAGYICYVFFAIIA